MKTITLILALLTIGLMSCRKDEVRPERIVMLGDSMTRRGDWNSLLNKETTNIGVDGMKSTGVLNKTLIDALSFKPTMVYLMIGFNDADNAGFNVDNTINNITSICDSLDRNHIDFVVQSVIPPTKEYNQTIGNNTTKSNVDSINDRLEELCKDKGYKFIDIRPALTDGEYLIESYSVDGVHLNEMGYKLWASCL
jgi:lysophospholipase L1-like esterase